MVLVVLVIIVVVVIVRSRGDSYGGDGGGADSGDSDGNIVILTVQVGENLGDDVLTVTNDGWGSYLHTLDLNYCHNIFIHISTKLHGSNTRFNVQPVSSTKGTDRKCF